MRRPSRSVALVRPLCLAALAVLVPAIAAATSYNIATFADDAVVNANCTLREAIRAASTNAPVDACPGGGAVDTITLPTGTYPFSGEEVLTGGGGLTIQSATLNPFNVSIDLGNAGRFLSLMGSGPYVLGGLEIKNGLAPVAEGYGGAVVASNISLQIFNFRFLSNHAAGSAGALFYFGALPGQNLVVHNGAFLSNSVTGVAANAGSGGAASVGFDGGADADLRDVTFIGNSATDISGFGSAGGALRLEGAGSGSVGACVRCRFQNNSASSTSMASGFDVLGGAVYAAAFDGARLDLTDGWFTGNSATASATGAKVSVLSGSANSGAVVVLERLLVDFNGGASDTTTSDVWLFADGAASALGFFDSQVTFGSGRGLIAGTNAGTMLLGHLTVADYPGDGVRLTPSAGGPISLQNSIAALNGANLLTFGTVLQTTNLIGGDPLFLNEPGGDYHLSVLSLAVGGGTNGAATVRFADLDHRGRTTGGVTDIGCYEYEGLFADNFEVGDGGSWSVVVP